MVPSNNGALVVCSIVVAVIACYTALAMVARSSARGAARTAWIAGGACALGIGVWMMAFAGLAAQFPTGREIAIGNADPNWLAVLVIVVMLALIAIALVASVLDKRMKERTAALATSLEAANEELKKLALIDGLTKLPNRLLLEDRMTQALEKARRDGTRFAVMFMDLDGFKSINDAYGHHVGDELLVAVAERVRGTLRARDTLARIGGDEFVALLEIDTPADAATVAQKIVAVVNHSARVSGHDVRVTVSIGVAVNPEDGIDRHELLVNADAAMYHAKEIGRNCYCFFEHSMNADAQELLELLDDLRTAIDNDEFVLHYQPKHDTITNNTIGMEALVRWQHHRRGLVQPDTFIPLAEKAGLIAHIGEWVLNEACRQMRIWSDAGRSHWTIAVNISALQFNAHLVEMVRTTLARHQLDPHCLVIEITESTAMRDADNSLLILDQLSALGVGISIDDFGTGYSSLMHLKRLPATELKIDRGFISELAQGTEDAAIVASIIALGQTLNLTIVAEGVETEAQRDLLAELGCHSLQGFWFARPKPAAEVGNHHT